MVFGLGARFVAAQAERGQTAVKTEARDWRGIAEPGSAIAHGLESVVQVELSDEHRHTYDRVLADQRAKLLGLLDEVWGWRPA